MLPGNYKIYAGQDVMISVYNIHHSAKVSFHQIPKGLQQTLIEDDLSDSKLIWLKADWMSQINSSNLVSF